MEKILVLSFESEDYIYYKNLPNDLNLNLLPKHNGKVLLGVQEFVRSEKVDRLGAKKVWRTADVIIKRKNF